MKISIITAVYNRCSTIEYAMASVLEQEYPQIEYIVVDGNSNDGTDEVIRRHSHRLACSIREADRGIYDALNKGIRNATGEIIGFLHADDFLASPRVITQVAEVLSQPNLHGCYGDLQYVDPVHTSKVRRHWVSGAYDVRRFRWGWMPPHPTVYFRRQLYEDHGLFREDFQIAADYELLVRMMVKHRAAMAYLNEVLVKMRVGGKSNASVKNRLTANREDRSAWVVNGMRPPTGLRLTKPLRKLSQFAQSAFAK